MSNKTLEVNQPWISRTIVRASRYSSPSDPSDGERLDPGRADSRDGLEALKHAPAREGAREISLVLDSKESTNSFGERSSRSMKKKRMLVVGLVVLVVGMTSPFGRSYLHSYESTDDAQIDGHIDPLSSRIDGTVIAVLSVRWQKNPAHEQARSKLLSSNGMGDSGENKRWYWHLRGYYERSRSIDARSRAETALDGPVGQPNPLEIVVTLRTDGDDPDRLAELVERLRYGFGHYSEWTILPAPLFFERVGRDYISSFSLEDTQDEEDSDENDAE